MGTYMLSGGMTNGAPLYTKSLAGDGGAAVEKHFLYRSSINGKWLVTDKESDIAKNRRGIESSTSSDLPSESGLTWQYYDGSEWPDDPNMRCTEVRCLRKWGWP